MIETVNVNVTESDTTLASFIILNKLDKEVEIYCQNSSGVFTPVKSISKQSRSEATKPDFTGQVWQACDSAGRVLSAYMAYPGCTSWDIVSFETGTFIPSAYNARNPNLRITNNLKTYLNICCVLIDGSLSVVGTWAPGYSNFIGPVYIGTSLIALQGDTVISQYIITTAEDTNWNINTDVPHGAEEIFVTGDNNYIFYQVTTPQDDTVAPASKVFSKTITVPSGTELLYASLFQSENAYFAMPPNTTISINSTNTSEGKTTYNTNTNTDDLYIEMASDGVNVRKLCVKNPISGQWTIDINTITNTSLCFQFQTVPIKDQYTTMRKTLSPSTVLGSG